MSSVQFYVYNETTRRVVRAGACDASQVSLQAGVGERAVQGVANPEQDIVQVTGGVQTPTLDVPHNVEANSTRLTGLPNPTTVSFPGQTSVYRTTTGEFINAFNYDGAVTLTSRGFRPTTVFMLPDLSADPTQQVY